MVLKNLLTKKPKMKEQAKNATLDSLAIVALGTGISLIPADKLLEGVILIAIGVGLSLLKYHLRRD